MFISVYKERLKLENNMREMVTSKTTFKVNTSPRLQLYLEQLDLRILRIASSSNWLRGFNRICILQATLPDRYISGLYPWSTTSLSSDMLGRTVLVWKESITQVFVLNGDDEH